MAGFVSRKKPYRFNDASDIKLLREVLVQNPFQDQKKWVSIAEALSDESDIHIDNRRARERTSLLAIKFKKEERESMKRSGVDEDFTEKDALLTEVLQLIEEERTKDKEVKCEKNKEEETAKAMRKRAMEGMIKDEARTPKAKKFQIGAYLREKHEADKSLKEQELRIRQDELVLQRQRFELKKEGRRAALEIQKKQNEMMMMLINNKTN